MDQDLEENVALLGRSGDLCSVLTVPQACCVS